MCVRLLLLSLLFAAGCTSPPYATIADGSGSRSFRSKAEFDDYVAKRQQLAMRKAIGLPFDYVSCAGEVLASGVADYRAEARLYVSIYGNDPSADVLLKLQSIHRNTFGRTSLPIQPLGTTSSDDWTLYVSGMEELSPGNYVAVIGYHCGSLCAGFHRYHLEKAGTSCRVLSKEPYGPVS